MAWFLYFFQKKVVKRTKKKLAKKFKYKNKFANFFQRKFHITENSWIYKKYVSITTTGTFENFVYTSFLGFLGGIVLTYMFFFFFVFQLNFSLTSATVICSIIGIILTLGLAYFMKVRCIVFLLLPQFCSKKGRQALMAYAFILTLTGPAKNTLHNIGVLSESLACGQDQLKEAVKLVMDLIRQPFYALKDSVTKIIKSVKLTVKRIKESLMAIKRLALSILAVIKAVFQWLASIVNICNKTLGTPFDRCGRVFEGAIFDCKAKLGPVFADICNIMYPIKTVCYIVKPLDFICSLMSYVSDAIVGAVEKQIRKFTTEMRAMFYVKVKFSHSFNFDTNQSRTFEEISTGIVTEIRQKTEKFIVLFDWMSFFTAFFVFFMLVRVFHYRHKWLTNDRYDNRYITEEVRKIDAIRIEQNKETILPLGLRESMKYASLGSLILIKAERRRLAKSTVFLSLATFKFIFHIVADYSLYWMLDMIRYHGRIELKVQKPNSVGVHVSGTGFLAELYKSIIKAFSPMGEETYVETIPCLPEPTPPDYDRYLHILLLIIFCWLMTLMEPYCLRIRHVVMNYYHPNRARQRAVWLYNHIIRSRGSFLKFARRQLRRKFGITNGQPIEKVTLADRMYSLCPALNFLFPREENNCILCGSPEKGVPHVKCPTPNCVGLYCATCFLDLQNICTICKSPVEYGDYSDLSEEKDSSEDEVDLEKIKLVQSEEDTEGTSTTDFGKIVKEETDSDQDSLTSYSYQYESPSEATSVPERISSRDVEGQKLRDDVTTQIFQYSNSVSESESESELSPRTVNPITETESALLSASSEDRWQSFAPDNFTMRMTHEEESDKNEETALLLPKRDGSRVKGWLRKIIGLFGSRKFPDKRKEKQLENFRKSSDPKKNSLQGIPEEEPIEKSTASSDTEETVLFLNVPEGGMRINYIDGDYLIVNDNFSTDSGSEENGYLGV